MIGNFHLDTRVSKSVGDVSYTGSIESMDLSPDNSLFAVCITDRMGLSDDRLIMVKLSN